MFAIPSDAGGVLLFDVMDVRDVIHVRKRQSWKELCTLTDFDDRAAALKRPRLHRDCERELAVDSLANHGSLRKISCNNDCL